MRLYLLRQSIGYQREMAEIIELNAKLALHRPACDQAAIAGFSPVNDPAPAITPP